MASYQTYSDVGTYSSREIKREKIPYSITTSSEGCKPMTTLDDSLPRTLLQPLAMNSPLNAEHFAIWPPTPRNPSDLDQRTTADPEHYMYSTAESLGGQDAISPWDPALGIVHENSPPPVSEQELPTSNCGSSVEGDSDWSRSRSDYGSMLGVDSYEYSSSYGSSNSSLFPSYFTSQPPMHGHSLSLDTNIPRRISDAASLSSADVGSSASTDYTRYDDLSAYGDGSLMPDYAPHNAWPSSTTPLSPVLGPAQRFSRSTSRSRGSPSPSRASSYRTAPYDKTKRWSTGNSYSGSHLSNVDPALRRPAAHSYNSSPIVQTLQTVMPGGSPYLPSQIPLHQPTALYLPATFPDPHGHDAHMMAHGLCLPSHSHDLGMPPYAEYSDPPNLYGALNEEQIPPPPEDMNPEDPDMKPHEQDLRFDGDLYTPRWVRGHGNKREGWCGICKPGRWLVLKNSAFWYDKSFTHGISAATGMPFHEPRDMRRMDGNPDVWEGLCHSCNDWVPLVSNKKKGTTWFRHAYRCHTHNKVKDGSKRRRESNPKNPPPNLIDPNLNLSNGGNNGSVTSGAISTPGPLIKSDANSRSPSASTTPLEEYGQYVNGTDLHR